ncbi:uncharacterized protein LOC116769036 [Danaus plexippus]|uniref:uncharacterized protein LOC116769036 n=1 Tax=Danaus plexippus TaxID=13037 RepID=UPI0013C515A5|nr:uncharacterized protein LOC116769036 [Danaus plexippus]
MRESLILIIYISAISVKCTNLDDGFNLYKNYLRSSPAEEIILEDEIENPTLYFYRTPLQLYPGLFPKTQALKYKKVDSGTYRSRMLNKDVDFGSLKKRTSKTALSLMLQSKQADNKEGHYCPYGK